MPETNLAPISGWKQLPASSNKLIFPSELASAPGNRPIVRFTCEPSPSRAETAAINLPCPEGLTFGDGGSYSTIDLGVMGAMGAAAKDAFVAAQKDSDGSVLDMSAKFLDNIKQTALGANGAEILRIFKSKLPAGIGEKVEFSSRAVANPRQNTRFESNSIRSFSFGFKMISSSESETQTIKDIHTTFRHLVYAEKTGLFSLKYPPLWAIQFLINGRENEFIPKIHKCYLTGVNTTINSGGPTWRVDGSPLEVDMQLSFQEVKVLTRGDIAELDGPTPNRDYGADADIAERISVETRKVVTKAASE